MTKELLQQVLDALLGYKPQSLTHAKEQGSAVIALREAIAQAVPYESDVLTIAYMYGVTEGKKVSQPVPSITPPDMQAFIKWAEGHGGLDTTLAKQFASEGETPVCENGWLPATFRSAMTEIAWRAWANEENIAQPVQPDDHIAGVGNMVQPVQPTAIGVDDLLKLRRLMVKEMAPLAKQHDYWPGWPGTVYFANAAINSLKAFAVVKAQPVSQAECEVCNGYGIAGSFLKSGYQSGPCLKCFPDKTQPAHERNFCQRCGQRLGVDYIHTCTPPEAVGITAPVAIVIEDLENDGNGFCAKVRWLFNPVPVGEELLWRHPVSTTTDGATP